MCIPPSHGECLSKSQAYAKKQRSHQIAGKGGEREREEENVEKRS